jgi:hypothetical protein
MPTHLNRKRGTLYYIENKPYKQPIALTVYDYPAYIRGPYKIQIKLNAQEPAGERTPFSRFFADRISRQAALFYQ